MNPMTKEQVQALQAAANKIYPGLTMLVRDVNLPAGFAEKYKEGMIIREKGFVDCTFRVGGMVTTHRYGILTNHAGNLSKFEEGTNWGLCVCNKDSHFKVLGTHTCGGKTIILLLHLPDDPSWKLFENVVINTDKKLVEECIKRFEAKCGLPPIPEVSSPQWLDRCAFPVGMDDSGNFFPLGEELTQLNLQPVNPGALPLKL